VSTTRAVTCVTRAIAALEHDRHDAGAASRMTEPRSSSAERREPISLERIWNGKAGKGEKPGRLRQVASSLIEPDRRGTGTDETPRADFGSRGSPLNPCIGAGSHDWVRGGSAPRGATRSTSVPPPPRPKRRLEGHSRTSLRARRSDRAGARFQATSSREARRRSNRSPRRSVLTTHPPSRPTCLRLAISPTSSRSRSSRREGSRDLRA